MNTKIVIKRSRIPNRFSLHITDFILMWLFFDRIQAHELIQGVVYTLLVLAVLGNFVLVWQEKEKDIIFREG